MWWMKHTANTEELEARLRGLAAPEPSAGLSQRLHTLPDFEPHLTLPRLTQPRRSRLRRAALAMVLAAGCVAVWAALLTAQPGPAFAEVEHALRNLRTANWRESQSSYSPQGMERVESSSEMWARLDPPAIYRENDNGFRSLINQRGQLVTSPDRKSYELRPKIGKVVSPAFVASYIRLPESRKEPALGVGWTSRRELLNGAPAVRFDREYHTGGPGSFFPEQPQTRLVETIWTDPHTYRPIRTERRQYYPGSTAIEHLTQGEDYRYNEQPPAGTWEWNVPPEKVAEVDDDPGKPVWRQLSRAEREKLQTLVDQADRGWVNGDMAQFAAAWDFGGLDRFPEVKQNATERRRQWQIRLANTHLHAGYGAWTSPVKDAIRLRSIPGLGSLPAGSPDLFLLFTATKIGWKDGYSRYAFGSYYVERQGNGYRIVRWNLSAPVSAPPDEDGIHRLPDFP